jgi:signal transduction histidine kinase
MNVRQRLTLWNMGVVALTLIGLGLVVRGAIHAYLDQGVNRELIRQVEGAKRFARRIAEREPPTAAERAVDEQIQALRDKRKELRRMRQSENNTEDEEDTTYFPRLVDAQDKASFGWRNDLMVWDKGAVAQARQNKTVYSTVQVKGERLRLCTALVGNREGKPLVGQFSFRMTDIERGFHAVDRTLLTLLPLALLLTAGVGALLTRKAVEPIEAALENEREALARQRRFIADASHELKTPLAIIKAATSLGLDTATGSSKKTLERIDMAANRTNRIVTDLMTLAQSDNSQLPLDKSAVAVQSLLTDIVEQFTERVQERTVRVEVDPVDLTLSADPHHLSRALSNLVDNALRHTSPTGVITLQAEEVAGSVVFTFRDNGEGVPVEHQGRLFDRFYRVDSSRSRERGGSGLGLAIAKELIVAHGGTIALTSAPGTGTTVMVTLPTG